MDYTFTVGELKEIVREHLTSSLVAGCRMHAQAAAGEIDMKLSGGWQSDEIEATFRVEDQPFGE